ncbi:unnamed protein product [Mytilus coruscus]|uniref:Reverse transcriptase domain-containing protein n=1 Tax=Mytilus coruscus TaxID=42192 RepID=A0A6J8AI70_MYTCO|nr:unnamed protein product [Mytilus coruscus]
MSNKEEQIGNLQLMRNQFGYCIHGSHPLLEVPKLSNHGIVRIYWASGKINPLNDIHVLDRDSIKDKLDSLFDIEGPGKQTTLKCGSCKCGKCAIGQSQHSIREERELHIIKSGMTHDEESQQWIPYQDLDLLKKRLLRNSLEYASAYDEQIMDIVKRGIARKLTKEEMEIHSGPVHNIPHHEVLKPESKSTPLRIVFNSSSSYMGHTLNDYWAKGSNVINDLLAVLIRFRQESIALAGDISKMYNAIRLSPLDQHTHRFVWRNLETHRDSDHYALLTVTFGDRPSGAISTFALHQTAKMYQHIYPDASKMVIRNSYVDDILQSVESVDNARLITQQTEKMLAYGGFRIKHWIISGNEKCGSTLQSQYSGESVEVDLDEFAHEQILGMRWDPKQDLFDFKVKINFSPKYKNVRKGENITKSQIESSVPTSLTPRMVLSQVASVYDPLGLATPYTLAAKVLMRKLCIENNTNDKTIVNSRWDYAMSAESRLEWMDFFKELFDIEQLKFHKCLKPDNAVGDPMLVIFSDGSKLAYGTCAYVRWGTAHGGFESRLVIAKNRIAPTKQMSVPRLELCGAVLAARIRQKLVEEMDYKFSRVTHSRFDDCWAQIQRESYGFGTFVAKGSRNSK